MTLSGKKLTPRTVRQSVVTNSRNDKISDSDRRDLARTMNHDPSTAEKYYAKQDMNRCLTNSIKVTMRKRSLCEAGLSKEDVNEDDFAFVTPKKKLQVGKFQQCCQNYLKSSICF